ncbi:MAG: EMC3/TMCO1 family protein [Nitrososphaerota archaeon]|nr:EMC3/TMCO1 family protein [Nitrososphaerota archaeon]
MADLSLLTVVPYATVLLMAVAFVMTFVSQSINRVVINHFIGWDNYRSIRKEVSDHNKARMDAARANDQKQLEKLKKKDSQIAALNTKMMKPQMVTMVLSFFVFIPLYVLRPYFLGVPVAYLPGFENGLSYFYWYLPMSFFVSTLLQRVLGTLPIEW